MGTVTGKLTINNSTLTDKFIRIILLFLLVAVLLPLSFGCSRTEHEEHDDLFLGNEAFNRYDIGDAEMHYQRFLRKNFTSESRWWVWNRLIDIALNVRQQKSTALEYLEIMLEEYSEDSGRRRSIEITLANLCKDLSMYERAISLWESLASDPATAPEVRAEAYRNLSGAYLRQLEFTNTTDALLACLQLDVSNTTLANCYYDLAETRILLGELGPAEADLRTLISLEGVDSQIQMLGIFMLADVLDQKGSLEEAFGMFLRLKNSHPNSKVVEMRLDSLETRIKKAKK